jgi:site-specific DNA-methyltransferase (adenine-specific)
MKPQDNTLYEGDCLEWMRQWEDACIDHCITDPPYNMSKKDGLGWAFSSHVTMSADWDIYPRTVYLDFCRAWLSEVCRVVKPNGNIFIFGSLHNIYDLGYIINEMGLRVINSIVWFKNNTQPNITCRTLTESTEHVIWACIATKDKAKGWVFNYPVAKKLNGGKQMRTLWTIPYPSVSERQYGKHPSQKSIDMIARLILFATRKDERVLDCFGGSGTTAVMAQSFARRWVMIETNPEYNRIARERLVNVRVPLPEELVEFDAESSGDQVGRRAAKGVKRQHRAEKPS